MAFNVYDKEGKGEIATSMLGTVMKNLGHNLKPEQLEECIEAVDGDGKSFIETLVLSSPNVVSSHRRWILMI